MVVVPPLAFPRRAAASYCCRSNRCRAVAEKLEFALKLGYSETQLRDALCVLGMEVGQNELLSELVRLGAVGSSVGATGAVGGAGQHSDDVIRPRAKPTLPPSGGNGSSENSRLRPIVIDGSNVAMR